ncbi:MAG: hypothetical protein JXB13_00450 [Phycisphaerae bacterium]|nr:hypothetical protein [Phycisphaerae bacterium]
MWWLRAFIQLFRSDGHSRRRKELRKELQDEAVIQREIGRQKLGGTSRLERELQEMEEENRDR